MKDFFKSLQDTLISRVNNMLFVNFIIAWIFVNYNHSLTIFFKKISIDEKIKYIDEMMNNFDFYSGLFLPLLLTLFYIFAMPILNLIISILHNKSVEPHIKKYENGKLKNYYESKKELERARLESSVFVQRNLENEILSKENKVKQEAIKLEEKENKAKQEAIELAEKENKAKREAIELAEKENNEYKELRTQELKELEEEISRYTKLRDQELKALEEETNKRKHSFRDFDIKIENKKAILNKLEQDVRNNKEIENQLVLIKKERENIDREKNELAETLVEYEAIRKEMENYKARINSINEEEKDIIKIIAQAGGQININDLFHISDYSQVKVDYNLDKMKDKYTYVSGSTVYLTTSGKEIAINEGYVD